MKTIHCSIVMLVCASAFLSTGCGQQKRTVITGTVSYKGNPVTEGFIRIYSGDNHASMATIRRDGTFSVTDVYPGTIYVTVEPDPGARMQEMMSKGAPDEKKPPGLLPPQPKATPIPSKYKDRSTSGLEYTVTPETEKLDIQLE